MNAKYNELLQLKKSRPIWYKSLSQGFKLDVPSRKVSGYLASFNTIDEENDCLLPGCFDKSLREHGPDSTSARKIAYLFMHDLDKPIGRFTMLQPDDKGLYFEADVDMTDEGDQVLLQYSSGTLNQHSIGFRYVWDKVRYEEQGGNGEGVFMVGEVKLYEGSVVSIGMNENTPFTGFKSLEREEQTERLMKIFEDTIKGISYKDNYAIRQVVNKMLALSQSQEPEAVKAILRDAAKPQGLKLLGRGQITKSQTKKLFQK